MSYTLHLDFLSNHNILLYAINVVRTCGVVADKSDFNALEPRTLQQTGSTLTLLILGITGNAGRAAPPAFTVPNIWSALLKTALAFTTPATTGASHAIRSGRVELSGTTIAVGLF